MSMELLIFLKSSCISSHLLVIEFIFFGLAYQLHASTPCIQFYFQGYNYMNLSVEYLKYITHCRLF